MTTKLFEVRDRATCIPVMATCLGYEPGAEADRYLLRRSGYADEALHDDPAAEPYIVVCKLGSHLEAHYDPYAWRDQRTVATAHRYLIMHWFELASGAVLDVEHILGETDTPKVSERETAETWQ